MDTGGQFMFGELPDDFGAPEPAGGAGERQRGWLPPEDRLWRHPSELRPAPSAGTARRGRPVNRWAALTAGVVGAAAVAGVAVAVTRPPAAGPLGGSGVAATDTSMVTAPALTTVGAQNGVAIGPDVVQMADAMRPSLVMLLAPGAPASAARATGVVLPGGTLVATAAAAVGGLDKIDVMSADGRRHAGQLVGVDTRAGIAVVRVADPLIAASFADETVTAHQIAVAACVCAGAPAHAGTSSADGADVAVGMVRQVGTQATLDGGPTLVDAIEAEVPLGPASWGSVLLDDHGEVIGILDGERSTGDDVLGYFVPAPLAVGVADELAQTHHVARGWLGVVCADAPGGGAVVTGVLPGSPAAAAGLRDGDVLEAVDDHAVGSMADLQARLYTSPPGTRLLLTVLRSAVASTAMVTVTASPS